MQFLVPQTTSTFSQQGLSGDGFSSQTVNYYLSQESFSKVAIAPSLNLSLKTGPTFTLDSLNAKELVSTTNPLKPEPAKKHARPDFHSILDSGLMIRASSAATILGMAAWALGQTNQQIFKGEIPDIPYISNDFGNFAYGILAQALLVGTFVRLDLKDKLSPLLDINLANKILKFSPEIFALAATSALVIQEIFPFAKPFITPDLNDIPAALLGGLCGYLGLGRRLKRFMERKLCCRNISFYDSAKLDYKKSQNLT